MGYVLRKARPDEAAKVFTLIKARVNWMDEHGIRQWNVTDYLNVYPLEYYQENIGNLYVLTDDTDEHILCAAMLPEQDERWSSDEPAFYVHNFVSDTSARGSGRIFMRETEVLAAKNGKRYLRLDSARDNQTLAAYYTSLGFEECGTCTDGPYSGILRQKKVSL